MFKNWFRRRNIYAHSIEARLHQIEESVQKMAENGYKNHIHIDTVHLHHPVLRQLEFRLDSLDIEELSGSLNLGNNFGVRVSPKVNLRKKHGGSHPSDDSTSPQHAEEESATPVGTLRQTSTGYTMRFSSK